jgi:hypothetical protein
LTPKKTNVIFVTFLKTPYTILEPYNNSFWEKSNNLGEKERKQAGAELCQAQVKLWLASI